MTIVKGQIESLKRIKVELNRRGIDRFNSIGEINSFLSNYEIEKKEILIKIENDVKGEIESLHTKKAELNKGYYDQKTEETRKLNIRIDKLKAKYDQSKSSKRSLLVNAFKYLQRMVLKLREERLKKNFDKIILKKTSVAALKIHETVTALNDLENNREKVIYLRSSPKIRKLTYTKEVVDSLHTLIVGAIGENLVAKELQKLSGKIVLLNDFSLDFNPPIFNRKENDRIFSIQIDHLLITNAGVFIIETKNWSKESIENFDLRSPVQQIKRSSFALFVMLNSDSGVKLKRHHWGDKELPIRNLIVMINNKPKEKFKYVEVKTLKELNQYIAYFDPIFDDEEVIRIYGYLEMLRN